MKGLTIYFHIGRVHNGQLIEFNVILIHRDIVCKHARAMVIGTVSEIYLRTAGKFGHTFSSSANPDETVSSRISLFA